MADAILKFEADITQLQANMAKAEQVTAQAMGKIESHANRVTSAALSMGKGLLLGAAVGLSIDAISGKIMGVVDSMAHLKTVSEKTGSSVESLSKLGFIARQSESDIDSIASAMAKMSKGMAGADDETKGAGQALKFLGLNAKDTAGNLKDPADMYTEIAKKLATYADGAGKAALAQALWGKAGADQLPTLKLLAEQGDMAAKVTDDQATAARQYLRDVKLLDVQKNQLFKTIAVALLPTMTDFTEVMIKATQKTNLVNAAGKDLAADHSIEDWADAGAMTLAALIDTVIVIPSLFSIASSGIQDVYQRAKLASMLFLASDKEYGEAAEAQAKTQEELGKKIGAYLAKEVDATQAAMRAKIAARKAARPTTVEPDGRPTAEFNNSGKAGALADDAIRLAKKQLDGKLKILEDGAAREQSVLDYTNKFMAELRNQDRLDLDTYNGYRQRTLDAGLAISTQAYDAEIAVLQAYKLKADKASEKADAQNKIDVLNDKKTKAQQDALQQSGLLTLGLSAAQSELNKTMKEWSIQQDLVNAQAQFEIDMLGQGTLEVAKQTAARRIQLDVEERIRAAQKTGTVSEETIADLRAKGALQTARAQALITESYDEQRTAAFGATTAYRKYAEDASNAAAQVESAMTGAFKGMEDALVNFVKTGKLDFSSLADSIITDLIRIQIKQSVMQPATQLLNSAGGMGGIFSGIGKMLGFSDGGETPVGVPYMVGERGPEIRIDSRPGTIIPNHQISGFGSGGGSSPVYQSFTINATNASAQTIGQIRALMPALLAENKRAVEGIMQQSAARRGGRFAA